MVSGEHSLEVSFMTLKKMSKCHSQDQFFLARLGLPDQNPECQAPAATDAVPSHQWWLQWVGCERQTGCLLTTCLLTHPHSCSKKDAIHRDGNMPHRTSGKEILLSEQFPSIRKLPLIILLFCLKVTKKKCSHLSCLMGDSKTLTSERSYSVFGGSVEGGGI